MIKQHITFCMASGKRSNVVQERPSTTSKNIGNEPALPPCKFNTRLDEDFEDQDFIECKSKLDGYLSKYYIGIYIQY